MHIYFFSIFCPSFYYHNTWWFYMTPSKLHWPQLLTRDPFSHRLPKICLTFQTTIW